MNNSAEGTFLVYFRKMLHLFILAVDLFVFFSLLLKLIIIPLFLQIKLVQQIPHMVICRLFCGLICDF